MALTLAQLRKLIEEEGLKYFLVPDREAVMLAAGGTFGNYQFFFMLEMDGTFLQFRTVNYLHCPAEHPHISAVLQLLGELNYSGRLVKYGWDPSDGEIIGYVDTWLMDGTLTQAQFRRMVMENYFPAIDVNYGRIKMTIETGEDPGQERMLKEVIADTFGEALPPAISRLLDRLRGKRQEQEEAAPITEI